MRILHLIYDSPSNPWVGGGGSRRNYELYRRFPKTFRIDILSGRYPGAVEQNIVPHVRQWFVGTSLPSYPLSRLAFVIQARRFLRRHADAYDLIVEDFSPFSPILAYRYARPEKVICQLQNLFPLASHMTKLGPWGVVSFAMERLSLRRFDSVIFSSPDLRRQALRSGLHPRHSVVIPYGVDSILLNRKPLPKKGQVLFLGRLEIHQKGIDRLLRLWNALSQRYPDLKLLIAGSGKDEAKVRRMARHLPRVVFLGRVDGKAKAILYTESLLTLIPSRYESWGMVSLESQACGTPVVAADIPGLRQTLLPGRTGVLCRDKDHWLPTITALLDNRPYRLRLGAAGRRFARRFSWDSLARTQQAYYLRNRFRRPHAIR